MLIEINSRAEQALPGQSHLITLDVHSKLTLPKCYKGNEG